MRERTRLILANALAEREAKLAEAQARLDEVERLRAMRQQEVNSIRASIADIQADLPPQAQGGGQP